MEATCTQKAMTKESVPGDGDADGEILSFYYDGLILRRVTERFFVSLLFGRWVGRSVGVGSVESKSP